MKTVTLYARPQCHLCVQAREILAGLLEAGAEFELSEVDIELDPRLHAAYLERIPVVEVDGAVVAELFLDRDALLATLDTVSAMDPQQPGSADI